MRARLFFYSLHRRRTLSRLAPLRRASGEGRDVRAAKRSRSARTPSRSLRGAAASSTATETCSCDRFRRRASTRFRARSSTPTRPLRSCSSVFGKLDPRRWPRLHDRHLWFVWIARKVPHDVAERVRSLGLVGIDLKEEDTGLRVDTSGRLASTVLGFVGTDENGLDGVEYAYDGVLRGRSGRVTLEADEFGRPIPFGRERVVTPAQPGANRRADDRSLPPVRRRAGAREASRRVPRARWHGDRDGSVDRRDPGDGQHADLRSQPLLEVRRRPTARPRGHGRLRTRLDLQADHRRGRARLAAR